jgi:hypothetical protein
MNDRRLGKCIDRVGGGRWREEPEAGSDQILFVCILTVARISLVKGERYIRMSQTSMRAQTKTAVLPHNKLKPHGLNYTSARKVVWFDRI